MHRCQWAAVVGGGGGEDGAEDPVPLGRARYAALAPRRRVFGHRGRRQLPEVEYYIPPHCIKRWCVCHITLWFMSRHTMFYATTCFILCLAQSLRNSAESLCVCVRGRACAS